MKKPLALARKACLELSSVDEKYVNQTKNGNVPNVPELGCYMNCIFDHVGMKTEDGSIVWDKVVHLLPPTFQESAFFVTKECGTIRKIFNKSNIYGVLLEIFFSGGEDECQTALLTVTCFFTKAPEVIY